MGNPTVKLVICGTFIAGVAGCGGGGGGDSSTPAANTASSPPVTAPPVSSPPAPSPPAVVPPRAPSEPEFYAAPVKVSETLKFKSIAAGTLHTCAIALGGDTHCWGSNEYGQLGSSVAMGTCSGGTFACSGSPVRVEGGRQFVELALSLNHSCALDAAGEAYCWGMGRGGQLGDGLRQSSVAPVAVAGGLRFTALTANIAGGSTCGLTAAGEAWCWGTNDGGELGNGTRGQLSAVPMPLAASTKLKAISIGQLHACALDLAGNALCWGDNWFGQLGVGSAGGDRGFVESLTPVAVLGGLRFEQIVAAGMHSCGLQHTGAAHCWGVGFLLGATTPGIYVSLPEPVATTGAPWRSLHRGYEQTCAFAGDGAVYCWGQRTGADGDEMAESPTRIESDQPFTAVAAGGTQACAIALDELAYCWGGNSWGQVGRPPSDP